MTTRNVEPFFNSLITAQAPTTFTQKFLEGLEFKSTNDRLYIRLLKALEFLDPNGVPTERYYQFLDQSLSKRILADAIKEVYSDLFEVNKDAQTLSVQELKNKLKTLTQGKFSEKLIGLMANTFRALSDYAEWDDVQKETKETIIKDVKIDTPTKVTDKKHSIPSMEEVGSTLDKPQLHYNIQIYLPESRDPAVYDVLLMALKKHLF